MKYLITFLILLVSTASAKQKNVHIIYSKSSHGRDSHNNQEQAKLIKYKLEQSKYAKRFNVTMSLHYPTDESLVENADLIILSSDGGPKHALAVKHDLTQDTKKLDVILKKKKVGLIVIHWATDAPSSGFSRYHEENGAMMIDWIGAVYCWSCKDWPNDPFKSWTLKPGVFHNNPLKVTANKKHPITNGVPETFDFADEIYYNFFTPGPDTRNPVTDKVIPIHTGPLPRSRADERDRSKWQDQPFYWAFVRENKGRSVAMTSAHFYHTWKNPEFWQTFTNSIWWTIGVRIPKEGVPIETPTQEELDKMWKHEF